MCRIRTVAHVRWVRVCALLAALGPVAACSAVDKVPAGNRDAHVERVEHYSEPNAVDIGNFLLDCYKLKKR
jgi:hypothetical protein